MFKKAKILLQDQLKRGVSVKGLSRTLAAGVICGTFPLLGLTTGLSFVVGSIFKLNHAILQMVNYFLAAVQVIMIPVYISIGEWLVGATPVSLNIKVMIQDFSRDFFLFLKNYGMAGLHAILAWAILSVPLGFLVYSISKYFLLKSKLERGL